MSAARPYYERDGVTIYHGDCGGLLADMPSPSAVITDPPYSVSQTGMKHRMQPGKGSRNFDFFKGDADWASMTSFVVDAVRSAAALIPAAGSVYVFCGHRQFGHIVDCLERAGWATRLIVWAKKCPPPAPPRSGWPSGAELCVYGYKPGRTWNLGPGEGPRSNVLVFDSYRHGQPGKVDHPTQKPVGLIRELFLASTCVDDLVLDPFMGSGTTLVAAAELGRRAIGIEIEERYCEIAANRLEQQHAEMAA